MLYLHSHPQISEKEMIKLKNTKNTKGFAKKHNLRSISNYIRELLVNNPYITIKQLSYCLYELMGETEFGKRLQSQKYCNDD